MKLTDAWIHGLRRFGGEEAHRVRIDTKLVCLIGANETGKSTVLNAFELARGDAAIAPADRTRREVVPDDREIVRLRYRLDQADRDALSYIPRAPQSGDVQWFDLLRRANGDERFAIEPPLLRNRSSRDQMLDVLRGRVAQWWPEPIDEESEQDVEERDTPDRALVDRVIPGLAAGEEDLDDQTKADLVELADAIAEEDDTLATDLRALHEFEATRHPNDQAASVLWSRAPDFVRFDDAARLLESEYDLTVVADVPGAALGNLAALAELDLPALRDAIARGETGTVRDIREAANRRLAERYASWQQRPPVNVVLETEGMLLRIHVQSGTGPTMAFHERSDGLRQFVALVALTAQEQRATPPVLLIDEVETHLHYDAQSDLIEVLATQNAASQVVYTTHSAACLPEDVGLGVRVIEGVGELTASVVRQNFWRDEHPGMGALLMAMGAATLAFVPLRPAVIAEGGTELVLLPTLMREAIDADHLGFAVVPGSSSTPPERIAGLDLQGVRTVWILDADEAGRRRRDQLIEERIPPERILLLSDECDLEIEDVVGPDAYCEAVRLYAADIGGAGDNGFTTSDLPAQPCKRHEALLAWCEAEGLRPPGKIAIANKVLELAGSRPILADEHRERLEDLHQKLGELLERPAGER